MISSIFRFFFLLFQCTQDELKEPHGLSFSDYVTASKYLSLDRSLDFLFDILIGQEEELVEYFDDDY